jgi:FtsH-binding integral membrane protein
MVSGSAPPWRRLTPRSRGAWSPARFAWLAWSLCLLALGLVFWASRARQPTETDSVNLLLSLRHYDVRLQQPHPPGYPLVVGTVHVLTWAGSGLRGYELFAVLGTLIGLVATARLAALWWGGTAAVLTAAAMVATPLLAYYAAIVSVYPAELALGPLVVLACAHVARRDGDRYAVALPVLFALMVGMRPTAGPLMVPVIAAALWYGRPHVAALLAGAAGGAAVGLAWAVPMLAKSGGLNGWRAANDAAASHFSHKTALLFGASLRAAGFNATMAIAGTVAVIVPALAVAGVYALFRRRRPEGDRSEPDPARPADPGRQPAVLLALWSLPYLVTYLGIHFGKPGYALALLPPAAVATAGWAACWPGGDVGGRGRIAVVGFAAVVLAAWAVLPVLRLPWRTDAFVPTAAAIGQQDHESTGLAALAARCPAPRCTIVSTGSSRRYWFHEPVSLVRDLSAPVRVVPSSAAVGVTGEVWWVGAAPAPAVAAIASRSPSIGSWQVLHSSSAQTARITADLRGSP